MTTWYLYYRPQRIDQLDCTPARTALEKILASGKIPKALLLTGPRGIGKTSAARIMAKVINCEKSQEKIGEPCNQCDQCKAITAGTSLDVLEIDGASNRGIDDIRELRERVRLAPSSAKNRIYIIDEVHMLTTEAFNALLKTLEEPPAHAYFILCTTDPQKVPETIISRCTRIVFKQATSQETLDKLQRIVKEENLTVEDGALSLLAKEARGSFRDAVKLLEQAASKEKKISLGDVKELMGNIESADPLKLLAFLSIRDAPKSIGEIGKVVSLGANLKSYLENMVEILRSLLLDKVGVEEDNDWRWRYQHVASLTNMTKDEIGQLIHALSQAYVELRDAVVPQLPLELAAIEWCSKNLDNDQGKISEREPNLKEKTQNNDPKIINLTSSDFENAPNSQVSSVQEVRLDRPPVAGNTTISFASVTDHWNEVLLKIRPKNHSVEALLKASRPLAIEEGVLQIEVFYKFHKDRLETDNYRRLVEECLKEITGMPLLIKYRLGQRPVMVKEPEVVSPKPTDDDVSGKEVDEEIIKAATEIFKGTVVE
ncbi:MAG: polymerase III subunit gamma and tau protein [Microgenomates group bacterium GW2011_GWA2_44_7]|nr:MAG: polymerase III subunit gamma and tau protein [Microgenomates group bacterium GW2011_GWA2_44_7]